MVNKTFKKSSVIPTIIFILILFALFIKYLVLKLEIDSYKEKYKIVNNIIKNSENKCFYVEKALVINRDNFTELLIYLPYNIVPKGYENNILKIDNVFYFRKVVGFVSVDSKLLTGVLNIRKKEVCVG